MIERTIKKKFIIYPEDKYKIIWDVCITFVLVFSIVLIPLKLALENDFSSTEWDIFLIILDIFFAVDIILSFFTAFDDEDFITNDSYKIIAINYLKTWFLIDFLSIIPFDYIIDNS